MFASNTSQVSSDATYIEDVFSTYLYTGNGSTQTITNGIDLSTYGGMVWGKARSQAYNNRLFDTVRGGTNSLISNSTGATSSFSGFITSFNNNGFSIGTAADLNENGTTYTSWTFRKQPKFFDVVTWTGDDTSNRQIAHNLGSAPGCIILKSSSNASSWFVYHRSTGNDNLLFLNTTDAATSSPGSWATSSTTFTLGNANFNISGRTYVAYLFAHNAGGFGLTGTDNVISCGSFTTAGATVSVTLNYEPQFLMLKSATGSSNWIMLDVMRGMVVGGDDNRLYANSSSAETPFDLVSPTATGFTFNGAAVASADYIYIAIRRGPMKTPTSGTSVFAPVANTQSSGTVRTIGFPADLAISTGRTTNLQRMFNDRLRGFSQTNTSTGPRLFSNTTDAETTSYTGVGAVTNTGYQDGDYFDPGISMIRYLFRRAPGFFDEVCYTGNGGSRTVAHNLGVAPELMIIKSRSSASYQWIVYCSYLTAPTTSILCLNLNIARDTGYTNFFDSTAPSASVITLGAGSSVNNSGDTYVSYLFASCPGVSKVGSYTGNGSSQTINCGFTGGARFVLIKRTDSTGDWYVWDTARGIVSANDPRLSLNTTSAEVTTDDSIDPDNSGFIVNQVSATNINVSSATYIYLAIA